MKEGSFVHLKAEPPRSLAGRVDRFRQMFRSFDVN